MLNGPDFEWCLTIRPTVVQFTAYLWGFGPDFEQCCKYRTTVGPILNAIQIMDCILHIIKVVLIKWLLFLFWVRTAPKSWSKYTTYYYHLNFGHEIRHITTVLQYWWFRKRKDRMSLLQSLRAEFEWLPQTLSQSVCTLCNHIRLKKTCDCKDFFAVGYFYYAKVGISRQYGKGQFSSGVPCQVPARQFFLSFTVTIWILDTQKLQFSVRYWNGESHDQANLLF